VRESGWKGRRRTELELIDAAGQGAVLSRERFVGWGETGVVLVADHTAVADVGVVG